jgi:hypothetical protein
MEGASMTPGGSRRIGATADARGRDALLAAARRIDWRFLLPDPAPERIAVIGGADEPLRDALATFCASPLRWRSPPDSREEDGKFDLVVVTSPDPEDARDAVRLVAPGGTLRWEVHRKPSVRAARALLAQSGLADVAVHWHRPSFDECLEAIPMDAAGVLDHVLEGGSAVLAAETPGLVTRLLRRFGPLDWTAPCRAVTGRRGAAPPEGLAMRLRHLAVAEGGGTVERAAVLLATPRGRASAHALLFAFPEGLGAPAVVAKVARVPGVSPSLDREGSTLAALAKLPGGAVEGVPRLLERTTVGGCAALVESVVPGRPPDSEAIAREPGDFIAPFVDWIAELHRRSRSYAVADAWWEEGVERPLKRVEALFGPNSREAALAAGTRERTASLREGATAWVHEHGDPTGANLLFDAGEPGVVDWELSTPRGLVGGDLFRFLGFAARARDGAASPAAVRAALRQAFFGARPWAAAWVRRYATRVGLPAEDLRGLYVLAWARHVASQIERLDADHDPEFPADGVRDWIRRDPALPAWEDAVRSFADLRPMGDAGDKA